MQVFEREGRREKILEGRRREMKLKAKQQSAAGGGGWWGWWRWWRWWRWRVSTSLNVNFSKCYHSLFLVLSGEGEEIMRIKSVMLRRNSGVLYRMSRKTLSQRNKRDVMLSCPRINPHQSQRKEKKRKKVLMGIVLHDLKWNIKQLKCTRFHFLFLGV